MCEAPWSITTLARAFGMRVSALRYYDELGLLPPRRRRGAVRFYGRAEARRLAFIRHLHHEGLVSLADTATLLAPGTGSWQEVLEASARSIEEQMERLRVAGEIIAHMRRCPDPDPVARCPYLGAQMDAAVDEALARV